jgi:hypothetical protein
VKVRRALEHETRREKIDKAQELKEKKLNKFIQQIKSDRSEKAQSN